MSVALHRQLQGRRAPLHVTCTINAGALPADHWTASLDEGGGRVLGEGCHFVDLMRHWVGSPIVSVHTQRAHRPGSSDLIEDIAITTLAFEDGSLGVLHYLANGHKGFPKEEYTLFWEGRQARLTNFKRLDFWGSGGSSLRHRWSQDKGHQATLVQWLEGCADPGRRPPLEVLLEVSRWAIRAADLGS
jgi:predicted dehydrogenase